MSDRSCFSFPNVKLANPSGAPVPVEVIGGLTVDASGITISSVKLQDGVGATLATITAANALKIDGSGVTQPVSAASLPLPTGASTSAKQPALGTAGVASTDVLTVQGIASMTALTVTAASLPLPSGAATLAKQPALGTAGTASSDVLTVQGIASMTALKVDGSGVTQPISGTVTATPGTGTRTLNGGASVNTNGTVSSGAYSATFIFSSDFVGVIAGTTWTGANDRSFTTQPLPAAMTFGTITYTISAGSMRILTIT